MQKRRETRKEVKLMVLFGDNKCENVGFTSNISKHGMYLESDSTHPFDRKILMMLTANEKVFNLKGEVRWRMESPSPGRGGKIKEGMGVKIIEAPQEYLDLVEL